MSEVTKFYEKALIVKQLHPEWVENLTFEDEQLKQLYELYGVVPLKERDQNGCRIILFRMEKMDFKKFDFSNYCRLLAFIGMTMILEPETQISGIIGVIDCKSISAEKHIRQIPLAESIKFILSIQEAVPFRLKKIFAFNTPLAAVFLTDMAKTFMSQKMKDRFTICSTDKEFSNNFNLNIFPKEYGGSISIADMVEDFKTSMASQEENIKLVIAQEIDLTRVKSVKDHFGSFRKLEID